MGEHLTSPVEVSETVRDRIRTDLGGTAYGSIMLDGVSREVHQRIVVNTPYRVESVVRVERPYQQEEALFDLAPAQ